MNVHMVDYTGAGTADPARYAAERVIIAKRTRLLDFAETAKVREMTDAEIDAELDYVAGTIPASWEFVNYTVLIEDVSRAFTHQLVRTRSASFAQQSQVAVRARTKKGTGAVDAVRPDAVAISPALNGEWEEAVRRAGTAYRNLAEGGASMDDARMILPAAVTSNILMAANLRTITDLVVKRATARQRGEWPLFLELLMWQVKNVHPWAGKFLHDRVETSEALRVRLEKSVTDPEERIAIWKLVDRMAPR